MKLLVLGSRDPHYGSDFLYLGLRKVLGEENVGMANWKESLSFARFTFPWACEVHETTRASLDQTWDAVIHVCPQTRDCHNDAARILDDLPEDVPLVLIDQEDYHTPKERFYTGSHPILAEFHRETREGDTTTWTFPMCYNEDLGFLPPTPELRDIDLFCVLSGTSQMRKDLQDYLKDHVWPPGFQAEILVGEGRPISMSRYYSLMRRSKMAVSDTGGGQDTNRFYEILCNGAMLLSRHVTLEFDHKPEDRKEAVYWHGFDDLINSIEHYHANHADLYRVAQAGYELGTRWHTSTARARFLVRQTARHLKERKYHAL